jgi:hypothetical protein
VSPLLNSRRPASNQRSSDQQDVAKLTPWHLIGLGFVALLGTGILAAVDRSQERAAASQTSPQHSPVKGDAQIAKVAETQVPLIQKSSATTPASAPAPSSSAAAVPQPAPASPAPQIANATVSVPVTDPRRETASVFISPAQAAIPQAPVAAEPQNTPAADAVMENRPQAAEGPVVTASLAPAAAPTRPADGSTVQGAITRGSLITTAAASTDCLPEALRTVLAELSGRFGSVTVVSTHKLNTGNHSSGSVREKLHQDCKAVDLRTDRSRIDDVKAYLRSRRGIVGVESYRNGVIHMDVSGSAVASTRAATRSAGRRTAAQIVPDDAMQAPAAQPQPADAESAVMPAQSDRSN